MPIYSPEPVDPRIKNKPTNSIGLPSLDLDVGGEVISINLNQHYSQILQDINDTCNDMEGTWIKDEWYYQETTTTEKLFCRCLTYLKQLNTYLLELSKSNYDLATVHLQEAKKELEWELTDDGTYLQDDMGDWHPYRVEETGGFWLRDATPAAKVLWEVEF